MRFLCIFAFMSVIASAAPVTAQPSKLSCVIATKILFVRESDRESVGLIISEDTELRVSNCESDNLCIVHYPIYGQSFPAFVDSRDLVDCFDARFKGRAIVNRNVTPRQYKAYTRPSLR